MKITVHSNSLVGLKRENNEDSYFYDIRENMAVFAVADGMGGHFGGEIASNCLIDKIKECWQNTNGNTETEKVIEDIRAAISAANEEIYNLYSSSGKICGTTIALMAVINDSMFFLNVGDTRIYSFIKLKLRTESTDHVFYEEEIRKKRPSLRISDKKYGERLTSAIGTSPKYKMDIKRCSIKYGRYLICSDGVYKFMSEFELFCSMIKSPEKSGKYIENCVSNHGAGDNYSYISIAIDK